MSSLSRRKFLQGTAAMPLALWLSRNAFAQSAPFIRYDIASPQGADMLATYANAMRTMLTRTETDPTSWLWQWYIHFVNGATTKANEVTRIFGTEVTPLSTLANEIWNTCQSHSGQNTNYFLPWHRMFVLFFEQIIREVSGRADFALPYWDYTSSDPLKRGILPIQFRSRLDPVFGVLYRADRLALANGGQRIDKNQPTDQMDITAAMQTLDYSNVGTVQGFCRAIDSGIHGRIHVLVGNAKNMGAVPYAARDPLFWVHHASIDRMWASWNAQGRVNPVMASWTTKVFVFADRTGQRVTGRIRDFFDTTTLGYAYDSLIPPVAPKAKASATVTRIAASTTKAELGAAATTLTIRRLPGVTQDANILGLASTSSSLRTFLVLKDLHTWKQPETLFHVYLAPSGNGVSKNAYVGAINFFDAEFHDHGGGSALDSALGENFFSFDVTDLLRRYERSGVKARDALSLTIVPGGQPRKDAGAMIASVELVRQ